MNGKTVYTILSIIIILSSAVYVLFFQKQTISREDVHSVEVKSETIESGIELELELKEADLFTSNIEYPFTKIEAIDVPIKTWIAEQENAFYEQLEQISFVLTKKIGAHFSVHTEVMKVNDHLFNFQLHIDQFIEEENENYTTKTFVVDIKNEKLVELHDVIHLNEETTLALKEILKNNRKNDEITITQIEQKMKSLEETNWLLTKDELIILFNDKKVAIPYKLIKKQLTDDYRNIFVPEPKKPPKQSTKKKDKEKFVAFTFDDGPDETVTPQILSILDKYRIKATFFMLSTSAQKYPEIAQEVAEKGHEVANHTINHANLRLSKRSRIEYEMLEAQKIIEEITDVKPTLFRPPYGEYNETVIDIATKSDQKIIMWSVDSYDWQSMNRNKIIEQVKKQTNPGAIILMHDIHQPTADALEPMIQHLHKSGYTIVTASELLKHIEPNKNGVYFGKTK